MHASRAFLNIIIIIIFEILYVDTFFYFYFFQKIDISQTHESNIFEIKIFMFMKYFSRFMFKVSERSILYIYLCIRLLFLDPAFKTPIINSLVNMSKITTKNRCNQTHELIAPCWVQGVVLGFSNNRSSRVYTPPCRLGTDPHPAKNCNQTLPESCFG